MLPSNYSFYHPEHQPENDEDFRQQYYQNRPHMQMQNYAQPHIEQQQFEQNQNHVQMYQSQMSSSSPSQIFYLNNPPHSQAPLRTRNQNGSSTPQYSSSIQKSALDQRPFASNSPSAEMSFQTSSGQLEGRDSGSRTSHGDSVHVIIRPTDAPRRGRPPKNRSGTPAPKTPKTSIPKRRGRPPKDYTALAKSADPELLMAKDPKDTHAKKPNSQSDDNQPKRRGRPPKQPSPEVEIQAPNPMYLIYKCEWKSCPAQLHNLATLRLHLLKNHGKQENAMYSCLWKGCNTSKTTEGGDDLVTESESVTQYKFKDENEWKSHVEKEHLTPYAWHMGDGPQNSLGGPKKYDPSVLPAYLFDKNGVQVTPSVKNQQLEDGDPRENNARRFKRRLSGLDYVLDPIYDSESKSSTQARESSVQENNEVHSGTEDEDEDDENVDMNSGSSI